MPELGALGGGTAHDYIEKRYGVALATLPLQTVAVLTTSTLVLRNNPRRFFYTIVNVGTGNVYVGFDATIANNTGILVAPLGGSISLSADEDGDLVTYNMYAIAAATGNTLYVVETQGR